MLKKELTSHCLVSLIWLLVITLLRWRWQLDLVWLWPRLAGLWLGGFLGTMLLDTDQILYALLIYPEEKAKELWQKRQIKALLEHLAETSWERIKLPFHHAIFQAVFYVFCFWVLTSTGSLFGKGLVMAMALHLLKDEFHLLLAGREEQLRGWLFWPIRREVSFQEQKFFVILMFLVFLGLNLLLL